MERLLEFYSGLPWNKFSAIILFLYLFILNYDDMDCDETEIVMKRNLNLSSGLGPVKKAALASIMAMSWLGLIAPPLSTTLLAVAVAHRLSP